MAPAGVDYRAGMDALRTPDDRFGNLPGYPFAPNYAEVDGLRIHYVDEGPRGGAPVLLLHGEPSWSYLYRKMIPIVVAAGHRAIAPDLVGFGRSDKPVRREDYTYQRHVDWMRHVLVALDLRNVTLVCQDWGGLLGLRLVAEHPDRFARVVAANTFLPTGDHPPGPAFLAWKQYSQTTPEFHVGGIIRGGSAQDLAPGVEAAYDAPFPDDRYKAGARQFHAVPRARRSRVGMNRGGKCRALEKLFRPKTSDRDPVRGFDVAFRERIPGTKGQPHTTIEGGGHFLQEDCGEELARVVVDFIRRTS